MKKIISILLVAVIAIGTLALSGCKKKDLRLGIGVYTDVSATDATEDKAGEGKATVTAAAVLLDKDGRIVRAAVDCAESAVKYTASGKAEKPGEFKTKYEQGADYGMVAYGGAAKEWFEQADAFCALVVGKTADELAGLVGADSKGTEEVISAGCTIAVSELVRALENAIANATETSVDEDSTLKLTLSTTASPKNAVEGNDGSSRITTDIYADAVDANGRAIAAVSDRVEVDFTFDATGKSTFDADKEILSRRQQGA